MISLAGGGVYYHRGDGRYLCLCVVDGGGRGRVDIFIAVTATMRETGLVAVYC